MSTDSDSVFIRSWTSGVAADSSRLCSGVGHGEPVDLGAEALRTPFRTPGEPLITKSGEGRHRPRPPPGAAPATPTPISTSFCVRVNFW